MPARREPSIFDFEFRGGLTLAPYLLRHAQREDARFIGAIKAALNTHDVGIGRARNLYEANGFITTKGEPQAGRGARVTLTLTRRGQAFARHLANAQQRMEKASDTPAPLRLLERRSVLEVLAHLEDHAGDADARYGRPVMMMLHLSQAGFEDIRATLRSLHLIDEEGRAFSGPGARLTYTLNRAGRDVLADVLAAEKLLHRQK